MCHRAQAEVITLIGCVFVAGLNLADAAESTSEFTAAKLAFLKEMKKSSPAARADAMAVLAKVAQPETADLLLKRGFGDDQATVKQAARKALRVVAQDPATGRHLMDELKRSIKKQGNVHVFAAILDALATTVDERTQPELVKILDDYLASTDHLLVPMTVIDGLGQEGGPDAYRGVTVLARAKPFDTKFGYRRCVVQAMSQLREREAIGYLIDLMPRTQGLVQYDIIQYLTKTTKQKFRDNDRDWTGWWKENQAKFQFPPVAAAGNAAPEVVDEKQPTYYGIPICAKRVLFVLDTSASMRGLPMEAAKNALLKTVEALPEAVNFDIVMFDRTASAWVPRLIPATYQAKQEAAQTVMSRGMGLGTASHAALSAAFTLEPEVIYFLSDGEPTDGQPSQIVESITAMNRTQRVSIHTIGVVTQRGGGAGLTFFMQPLAQQNYGSFRLIE